MRRIPFRVAMRTPVLGVTERTGVLIEGPAGWGECSPLPSWSPDEVAAAQRAAEEAALLPFPAGRARVEVNAMIPRVRPSEAAALARASGCRTIKVKVGDPDSQARVRAVREAVGDDVKIRLDANGAWDADTAGLALSTLAPLGIELIEDPCADLQDMARLRRGSPILIAAEMTVRTVADARAIAQAADVFVVKPQRIGGFTAALDAAAACGLPTIASSALETSVGLAMVVAVAAALPDHGFAHGVGTASLLDGDVTTDPLLPRDGVIEPRRVVPDGLL